MEEFQPTGSKIGKDNKELPSLEDVKMNFREGQSNKELRFF